MFPQQKQAGMATLNVSTQKFMLSNSLLEASYSITSDTKAAKGSERFDGKGVKVVFAYGSIKVVWRAVLRDGSHYLRTEMSISSDRDVRMDHKFLPIYSEAAVIKTMCVFMTAVSL